MKEKHGSNTNKDLYLIQCEYEIFCFIHNKKLIINNGINNYSG